MNESMFVAGSAAACASTGGAVSRTPLTGKATAEQQFAQALQV
jgi:hypothetical protein